MERGSTPSLLGFKLLQPTQQQYTAMMSSEEDAGQQQQQDAPSASGRRNSPSRTIRENVHTNILGRGAEDAATSRGGDGIGYVSVGSPESNNNNNRQGAMARINNALGWGKPMNAAANNRKRRNGNARYDGLQQSTTPTNDNDNSNSSSNFDHPEAAVPTSTYDPPPLDPSSSSVTTESFATAATREDQIRQDCSYFYQGTQEPIHRTRKPRGARNTAGSDSLLQRMSIEARMSGNVDGALFMSKYEQLNQVVPKLSRKQRRQKKRERHLRGQQYTGHDNNASNSITDGDNNHDLFLDEEGGEVGGSGDSTYREHIPSPTNNVVMGATSLANPHGVKSSMFFEQDGKMLMRLPRDQVRLVMDYNLEPGILSVEQWRSREEALEAIEKLAERNQRERTDKAYRRKRLLLQRERRKEHKQQEKLRKLRRKKRQQRKAQEQQQKAAAADSTNKLETAANQQQMDDDEEAALGGRRSEHSQNPRDDTVDLETSESSYSDTTDDLDLYSDDEDDDEEDLLPELKYVITIPDDLYRRMVGEISAKYFPPYWGFFRCCNQEQEHADIKLAILILSFVFFFLFIGSLEWRTT